MNSTLLECQQVSVRYGRSKTPVVQGVTFEVISGESVLLLGPNGAGKSTLMKAIAGQVRVSGGSLLSQSLSHGPAVALMPQQVAAMPRMTALEQVTYAGWLAGLPAKIARSRVGDALERVDLADQAGTRADRLSGGQLRRLGLAECLVQGAPLLLLDEPTAGLDPEQRHRFREVVARLREDTAVPVSTHETHDSDGLFTRLLVLVDGRLRFDGSPRDFMSAFPTSQATSVEASFLQLVSAR